MVIYIYVTLCPERIDMKNLEHIGNQFKVIARDPQILLDFHRGCQRFPESLKDPQEKGRKEKKQQYIYTLW